MQPIFKLHRIVKWQRIYKIQIFIKLVVAFLFLSFIRHKSFQKIDQALAAPTIALVSTSAEPITAFESANEAAALGAKILVYPEWGFLPAAYELTEGDYSTWKTLAQTKGIYVVLGVRYKGRNTILVFQADGNVVYAVRRDGINSPAPTLGSEQKPLVLKTPYGKFGVLVCDESRANRYLAEVAGEDLDALLVPNYIGAAIDDESLIKRYSNFTPTFTRYNADRLSQFGGSETHLFRKNGELEFNSFGKETGIGRRPDIKVDAAGLSYSISLHDLP